MYKTLFTYTCNDCGTNNGVMSVKATDVIEYDLFIDLCKDCLDSRNDELNDEVIED